MRYLLFTLLKYIYYLPFTLLKVNKIFTLYFCKVNMTVFVGVQLTDNFRGNIVSAS